jgi:hypothetical protein
MATTYTPSYGINNGYPANYGNQTMQSMANPTMFSNMNPMYGGQQNMQNTGSFMTVLVQGEAGANAYPVASGNTVMLMDFESNKFWLKSNVNGIPQRLRSFSFMEEVQEQPKQQTQTVQSVSREEFDNLSGNVAKLSDSVSKLIAELGGTSNE